MAPNSPDSAAGLNPDDVARRTFSAVRKGYDPIEVQGFLVSVASELREARSAILELEREVRAAQAEAERNRDLDPSRLTALLGEEMSRVLEAARAAADELRAKAVADSTALLDESRAEADRMRTEAAEVLAVKTAEAEAEVAQIRAEGDELREQAKADAAAEVEAGRQEGREMVAEAQKVRERMLQDLARRRKAFRQQIESLQAGRDRLMGAYEVVRETLDVATNELQVALPEARLAAESAALRPGGDEEPSLEDLEREAANLPPAPSEREADVEGGEAEGVEVPADETEPESATEQAEPEAEPDGRQGRRSSSVNVIRVEEPEPAAESEAAPETETAPEPEEAAEPETDGESGADEPKAEVSSLFARLREETEQPEQPEPEPETETETEPAAGSPDAGESFELVEEIVIEQTVVEMVEVVEAAEAEAEPDPDRELVARRDEAMVEVERTLSRRIKRELSDEQNELLDAVRRQKGKPTVDAVLPSAEAHLARYHDAALPGLATAASAGADLLGGKSGATKTKVGDLADELAEELISPLRDRIENCFREAAGDDEELAERLRACYREFKGQRVEEAVARLSLAACNRGLLDSLPPGTLVHWIVDDGSNPSPDCDDNALAGDLPKGEPFPTGHLTPPLGVHCRCLVAPRQG